MKRLANLLVLSLCAAGSLMAEESDSELLAAEQSEAIYAEGKYVTLKVNSMYLEYFMYNNKLNKL